MLPKATKLFSKYEVELIKLGYMQSFDGNWTSPNEYCKTVEVVGHGYYFNGKASIDGRFIIEPSKKYPKKDCLYDSYGDKTIAYSRYDTERYQEITFSEHSNMPLKCLYLSYWMFRLESQKLLDLWRCNG